MKIKSLMKNLKGFKLIYLGAIIAIITECFLSLIYPVIIKYSIDNIIGGQEITDYKFLENIIGNSLYKAALIMLLFTVISGRSLFFKGQLSAIASEGYNIEEKIKRVVEGLKIDKNLLEKNFNDLSGGEKSRVILGKVLLENPDVLLLDEPTNHLDIEFKEVFEDILNEYEGTLLFISHDRYFINSVAERILEIDNQSIYDYEGNYEYYKEKNQKLMKK